MQNSVVSTLILAKIIRSWLYPITHSRFATKILLRSEVKEHELRTQWDLYKPTEDSV